MTNDELSALKLKVRLSDYVRDRVKLTRKGPDWFGCCPFHEEKSGSFSVNDGKGFYHCFGCSAHGDVLDWLQKAEGMSFQIASERLRHDAGQVSTSSPSPPRPAAPDDEMQRKQREARSIWRDTMPIGDTIAETYLRRARCIGLEHFADSLRFHPALLPDPRSPAPCPAMVAAVTDMADNVVAIQRTFLKSDGSGKAAFSAPKRSLGPIGQGAVKLGRPTTLLGIAEGIETGLSAMEIFRVPVWCALGSNLARIDLPSGVRHVVIFADHGKAGEDAADKARATFRLAGRKVAVRFPEVGKDFNDQLKASRDEP